MPLAVGNAQVGAAVPGWCGLGSYSLPPPTFPAAPGSIQSASVLRVPPGFGDGSIALELASLYVLEVTPAFGNGAVISQPYISIFINDVLYKPLVNSVTITDALAQPTTASFSIWDPTGTINPQVGQQVQIYLGATRIFGGYIVQPFQTAFQAMKGYYFGGTAGGSGSGGTGSATSAPSESSSGSGSGAIQCADYSGLLSRRYIGLYFDGHGSPTPTFLSDMVGYIVSNYLANDGFTYDDSDGDPGINLGPTLFNWVTIQAAFNTLSSATGWEFKVDQYQVIRFFGPPSPGTGPAAYNIADNDGNVYAESLGIEYYQSTYRNKQGVVSPSQQGQLWQDIFSVSNPGPFPNFPQPPDGIRKTFIQLYGFTALPIVTVNGTPQTVAQLTATGFVPPTGWQWYIVQPQPGFPSYGIFQYGGNPALTSSDVLVIAYPTPVSPILWLQNDAQIAARAEIEGNTGLYEDVEQAPSVTDPAAIAVYCAGLLARYSDGIPFQVTYSTRTQTPLFSGQTQTINVANPPINFTGQISQVTWQDIDGQFMQIGVTVLSGSYQGNFTQFFAALVAGTALPPPSNTTLYQWFIENTGVQNFVTPQVAIVPNAVEAAMSVTITFQADNPAPCTMTFSVLQNGIITFQVEIPEGYSGSQTSYPTEGQYKYYAGDVLSIEVAFAVLFEQINNVSIQLYDVVLST
jgi:hypothetical protein